MNRADRRSKDNKYYHLPTLSNYETDYVANFLIQPEHMDNIRKLIESAKLKESEDDQEEFPFDGMLWEYIMNNFSQHINFEELSTFFWNLEHHD